jgi:hypothetical protein
MVTDSHNDNLPSEMKPMLKPAATMKKLTSRTKLLRATLKGRTRAIEPATTAVIKQAAPISSPMAKLAEFVLIAANVEKTSGLPLPKARNVTPAMLSLIPNKFAIVLRLTQKKSLAAMPIVLNNSASHRTIIVKATGFARGSRQ